VRYPGLESLEDYGIAKKYHKNGFGAIVAFGLKGGYEACVAFIGHLRLFSHLANIGDAKSLVIHPASTTHSQLSQDELVRSGVSKDFIRLSVGLEHIEDLLEDLEQAIRKTS
jgi:O-acetylhomoserine (thiol)-lyase